MVSTILRTTTLLFATCLLVSVGSFNAQRITICEHNPCQNGGKCVLMVNTRPSYKCDCLDTFYGLNCQLTKSIIIKGQSYNVQNEDSVLNINMDADGSFHHSVENTLVINDVSSNDKSNANAGNNKIKIEITNTNAEQCKNGGTYSKEQSKCICAKGYVGDQCQVLASSIIDDEANEARLSDTLIRILFYFIIPLVLIGLFLVLIAFCCCCRSKNNPNYNHVYYFV